MNIRRPIAENLAIAISQACWSVAETQESCQLVFRKPQLWLEPLAIRLHHEYDNQPRILDLVAAIESAPEFQQATKLQKTKKAHRAKSFAIKNIRCLDWKLPPFHDFQALASHLGMRGTTLHWLCNLHLGPDDRPRHYATRWIRKRSGNWRLIESPKPQLKSAQRIVLQDVLNRVPLHPAAHGFRRGRNVLSFASPHIGQNCCLRMDLKDFFPGIRRGRVKGFFRSVGYSNDVARSFTALCTTQTPQQVVDERRPPACAGAFDLSLLYMPGHLPQGAPTSPALANLLAYRLDARLSGLAESAQARYTRYADDLLFSGQADFARNAKRFAATAGAIALEEGFHINHRKTKIQRSSQRQTAAGIVLNDRPNLAREEFDRLKAILHNCRKFGAENQNRFNIPNFRAHILGRINWLLQLNRQRGEKLLSVFKEIVWDASNE